MRTSGTSGAETILVVDDAEDVRKMVCAMLFQAGYQALEASDGTEALQVLERHNGSVHLVLTDVIMPRMSGTELAQRLSQMSRRLPVIFMSGYAEDPIAQGALDRSRVLAKPFTARALVEKVRVALNSSAASPADSNRDTQ